MKGSAIFSGLVPFNHIVLGCSGQELASPVDEVGDRHYITQLGEVRLSCGCIIHSMD